MFYELSVSCWNCIEWYGANAKCIIKLQDSNENFLIFCSSKNLLMVLRLNWILSSTVRLVACVAISTELAMRPPTEKVSENNRSHNNLH